MDAPILTYADACLLMAAFRKDDARNSRAVAFIKDERRSFIVSDALWLELMPAPLRNKRHNEVAFYERFFARSQHVPMTDTIMRRARDFAGRYFLDAMDAIHIAYAMEAGADEFVSAERLTKPMFRVLEVPMRSIALE